MTQRLKIEGFGFIASESQHHFMVMLSENAHDPVSISEHFAWEEDELRRKELASLPINDPRMRVILTRDKWDAIADVVRGEFNQQLKKRRQRMGQWKIGQTIVERLQGKELVLLAWSIEDADSLLVPIAIRNWLGLLPEERWWLFTMTNAATGQALKGRDRGWRKAVRYALTENPISGYSLHDIEKSSR
jgi:hypothetical protein